MIHRRIAATVVLVLIGALSCRGSDPTSPPPAVTPSIPDLQLPDLTDASASVRDQLTDKFARLSAMQGGGSAELATAYGELGVLLLAAGYYDSAEVSFQHARRLGSGDPRWPYYLGHVYRQRNQPDRSVEAFEQARALQPNDVTTLVRLAEAQLSAGRLEAAVQTLDAAVRLAPQDARVLAGLGRAALARRDYASAIARFEDALRVEPQANALHYQLSMAYRGAGNPAKAEEHLKLRGTTELMARDPLLELAASLDSASMYDTRSRTALQRGDWGTAITEARRGLELTGTSPVLRGALHHRLGTALAQTGDTAGAEREFQASIKESNLPRAHYSLGVLRLAAGDATEALRAFARAIEADPTYLAARLIRADVLRRSGRAGEALAEYMRAIELDPQSAGAQFGTALALARLGRQVEARDTLDRAAVDHPNDRAIQEALARLLAASSNAAVRDPARALQIVEPLVRTSASFDAVETMARALAASGRFDEAVALQRDAVAQARATNMTALAQAMAETERLYQQRRLPNWTWREEPIYEPTQAAR